MTTSLTRLDSVVTTTVNQPADRTSQNSALFVVCMGSGLSPLCLDSVNVAIPSMASDLQADAALISWMPTIFLLSTIALMLPFGKLADSFGRKRIYTLGLAINACASLGAFFSDCIEWIFFFRFIQGVGSAMTFGTGIAIITAVFPSDERGLPLGLNTASVYIGLTIAPALGGLITETFSWRVVFLIPIPPTLLLLTVIGCYLKGDWRREQHSSFDWIGTLIFAGWALAFVVGLTGLPAWPNVFSLLLAVSLLALFIWHQARHADPLIRVQIFRESRLFSFSLVAAALMYAATYPLAFLLSLYLQYVRGLSPLESGQIILVQAMAMAILAPFAGKLSDLIEPRVISTTGCISVATGFALLSQLSFHTEPGYISTALLFIGVGFGLFSAPNHNSVMSAVSRKEMGVASAAINMARVSGSLMGVSLVNLLINLRLGDSLMSQVQNGKLLSVATLALTFSLGLVICASLLSATRGRIRSE